MNRREASLILGVPYTAKPQRIKDAHKKLMYVFYLVDVYIFFWIFRIVNHPDRGGSPYLASKINEAKDILESQSGHWIVSIFYFRINFYTYMALNEWVKTWAFAIRKPVACRQKPYCCSPPLRRKLLDSWFDEGHSSPTNSMLSTPQNPW